MLFGIGPINTIMLATSGSHAYGTSTPNSDLDIRGVCIAPMKVRLSYTNNFEQFEGDVPALRRADEVPWGDAVIYDVTKAVRLMANSNPNMLELLFLPRYRLEDERWMYLKSKRHLFVSQKCRVTFLGYARSQLEKMKASTTSDRVSRKPARSESITTHGYDTKHAMHLVRLMRMGFEILVGGTMFVDRTGIDADELLAIRNGEWTYDQVMAEASRLGARIEGVGSTLPEKPKHRLIDHVLYEILTW